MTKAVTISVFGLLLVVWAIFQMKTVDGVARRACQACGKDRVKLHTIPKSVVLSLFSQDFCLTDPKHQLLCAKCIEIVTPEIFQFTCEATVEDTKKFVKYYMDLPDPNRKADSSVVMQDVHQTPAKRHLARTGSGRFQKKAKEEVHMQKNNLGICLARANFVKKKSYHGQPKMFLGPKFFFLYFW